MDPEDLANIVGGGVNPEQPAPPDYAGYLGYATPSPAQVAVPAPTPESGLITSPFQVPEGDDNLPAPGSVNPGSLKQGTSVDLGSKVSQQGYSSAAMAAIQAGPKTALERGEAKDLANVEGEYNPLFQQEHQAAVEKEQADLKVAQIESQKIAATSQAKQKIAAANTDFQAKEQAAMDNAKVESAASIAQYRAALADYQASGVNPSQLWDQGGSVGQFAMIATAFGHDFLGAKGIQTSGLDTINQAIKNNINAQLENINKKQQVANGFKQIWDMQRQQSSSDAEARARVNGFYLAAINNQIDATLGSYDSQLALAKAQSAKAAINQEIVKNDLLVQQHIDTAANARATNRVKAYGDDLQAASARYTADAHVKAAEIEANAKNKPASPLSGVIFDTSTSGQNLAARRFLPDVKPEDAAKVREQTAKVIDTASNIEKLIQIQNEVGKVMPTGDVAVINKMQNEAKRTAELLRNTTKMGIIYDNSGKQINEQEVKLYDQIVSKNDWWTNGDNVRTLGTLAKQVLDKNNAVLSAISTQILPGDPAYGLSSGDRNIAKGETTLANIQSQPGAGRPEDSKVDKLTKEAYAPDAGDVVKLPHGPPDSRKFVIDSSGEVHGAPPDFGSVGTDWQKFERDSNKKVDQEEDTYNPQPTKAFIALEHLADLAIAGDQDAKQTIQKLADKPGETENAALLSAYAQWELSRLNPPPAPGVETVIPGQK